MTSIAKNYRRIKTLPDIDWVEIPAGKFIYGSKDEKNQLTLELDRFYIGRYTVTNMQYQTFIDDGGYGGERWWQGLEKPGPKQSDWPQPNRPKTNVNWYEAVAFCRWLSAQRGYEIQLPSEQQWEKVARGSDGRVFPWGNDYQSGYANVDEKGGKEGDWHLKQTTAVGLYPQGNSPQGVADMAGNVWEWCLNPYHQPDGTTSDSSNDSRVLRGGSWFHGSGSARASYRRRNNPDLHYLNVGFRVCCVLPSSDINFHNTKTNEENVALLRDTVADIQSLADDKWGNSTSQNPRTRFPSSHGKTDDRAEQSLGFIQSDYVENIKPDETLLFTRPGLQNRLIRRLQRGELEVGDKLDLHGYTIDEAAQRLSEFLQQAQAKSPRCVLINHGSDSRSPDKKPVLKSQVNHWLRQHDAVMGFSSAIPRDGGVDAVYVLLRRGAD